MTTTIEKTAAAYCTLEPEPLGERIAWVREQVLPHAQRTEPLVPGPGRVWTFAHTPERKAQLEHLVALESACCRGPVTFHLEEDAARRALRLVLRGVDPLECGVSGGEGGGSPLGRVAKAGGAGVAIALGVACALPWLAVAVLGTSVAAPLTGLDHPLPIGLLAVAATLVVWRRWGRRPAPAPR